MKEIAKRNNSLFGAMNMYYTLRNKYNFHVVTIEFVGLCALMIFNHLTGDPLGIVM